MGSSTDQAYSLSISEVLESQGSSLQGLSLQEVTVRQQQYGPNRLKERPSVSLWTLFCRQLQSPVVYLLAAAGLAALIFDEWVEGWAIFAVLGLNALIGFFMERSGVQTLEALVRLGRVYAKVLRGGKVQKVRSEELVPGDLVLVEEGDRLTADMRVIEAARLESDESALTGESLPCEKAADFVKEGTILAERKSMLYNGCVVTGGSGKAIVVATGMATELGKIASLAEAAEPEQTPLERRLTKLSAQLMGVILAIAGVTTALGIYRGYSPFLMVEVGVALAVAAIPEGLAVVTTIALSKGLMRLAKENGWVKNLAAIESLGSTTVICTDKTGTLTESQMMATLVLSTGGDAQRSQEGTWQFDGNPVVKQMLRVSALCSNASLNDHEVIGEATEAALVRFCQEAGEKVITLREAYPECHRVPFNSVTKMMATYHRTEAGDVLVAVKGAPDVLCQRALQGEEREIWMRKNHELAAQGFRVLAMAEKRISAVDSQPFEGLTFLGIVALYDPPRAGVKESILLCQQAGIRVIMVTGDQAPTARYVARNLGIVEGDEEEVVTSADFPINKEKIMSSRVVSRVSPENKLDLIRWYQERGEVVAMTGDGVNDAPALKKADIGVAMGQRGTEVAREAADLVLLDDAFQTIVRAIQEGRVIFDNIRDFVRYLLGCNLAEVLVIFIASVVNMPLPILPMQILFINMVTDVFPALALGISEGKGDEIRRPPRRPEEEILTPGIWRSIGIQGVLIACATLLAFWLGYWNLAVSTRGSVTLAFMTLGFSQLWVVFSLHSQVYANPYIWVALGICSLLLFSAVLVPPLASVLHTEALSLFGWGTAIGCSLLPLLLSSLYQYRSRFGFSFSTGS